MFLWTLANCSDIRLKFNSHKNLQPYFSVAPVSSHSHKKLSFAIINDYKNRKTRLQKRHSDDNISLSGRFSPYSRYIMQRELSAPALNRMESYESDDGEFYYVMDDEYDEEGGRKTSIGFVHNKQMSASMSNLSKMRPASEMRRHDTRYMSTPNFIKINKRAVIQSIPMERINPRLLMHRSLKGVLKVYNNTNIKTKNRQFSLENTEIFLPNGRIDPNLLTAMPINNEEKRSEKLKKHQAKAEKKRKLALKKRKLSPIAGTPHKEAIEKKTPKHLRNTPKARLEERLKKDKFGRLLTPKKAALPDFRNPGKKSSKKTVGMEDEKEEELLFVDKNEKKDEKKAINFLQQIQARSVLGRSLKAKLAARKEPPPLTRQPSKISIDSINQDSKAPPSLKKKSSFSSLKSVSNSIRTITSFTSRRSHEAEVDEAAEAGDEITKLQNVKNQPKGKVNKGSILAKTKAMSMTNRMKSAAKEQAAPPPSRTASKTSIFSASKDAPEAATAKATETPSRKSDVIRVPSATSIMSMTTAAITSNPLATTLHITNQLATQGADILNKKTAAGEATAAAAMSRPTTAKPPEPVVAEAVIAAHPDADKQSMASQKTMSSQKTDKSGKNSRKTSAKHSATSRNESAKSRVFSKVVGGISVIRYLRRKKSNDSINSETSDATQLTTGQGNGAENEDFSAPTILEKSKKSLEKVQNTVDKATSEINQTINANLKDLRTLEKKLSKENLLDHDDNNNAVGGKGGMSRQSTKSDMAGSSKTTAVAHMSGSKTKMNEGEGMNVNTISVAPGLQQQASQDSNQMNSSTR